MTEPVLLHHNGRQPAGSCLALCCPSQSQPAGFCLYSPPLPPAPLTPLHYPPSQHPPLHTSLLPAYGLQPSTPLTPATAPQPPQPPYTPTAPLRPTPPASPHKSPSSPPPVPLYTLLQRPLQHPLPHTTDPSSEHRASCSLLPSPAVETQAADRRPMSRTMSSPARRLPSTSRQHKQAAQAEGFVLLPLSF